LEKKKGIIFRSTGSWYETQDEDGEQYSCRLKGKFKIQGLKVTNPLAVGDHVVFMVEDETEKVGIIFEILPRKNYIIRKSVHKTAHGHILASNLDQLILIVTLASPKTSLGFIDRLLVTAETFRIPVLLVFNKFDLLDAEEKAYQDDLIELYVSLGYDYVITSAEKKKGIKEFLKKIKNKVSLVAGHSGVGKSSLINILDPDLDLVTNEISTFSKKGIHTTTFAEMFEIADNTYIIDSPGINELGLMDINNDELSHYFPEFRDLMSQCKFHNCKHINEPKCAVKDALDNGLIAVSRYLSYISMFENEDNRR
jgi:ribosome biogenesis GTPase / thiamine phosphate phosphatase